ncbi:MAG: hypothetical protein AAF411_05305 [Myxococcota bacterium]
MRWWANRCSVRRSCRTGAPPYRACVCLIAALVGCETVQFEARERSAPPPNETDSRDDLAGARTSATHLQVGPGASCAVLEGGALWCWGKGSGMAAAGPQQVAEDGVTDVSVGAQRYCFLRDGEGYCAGRTFRSYYDANGPQETHDAPTRIRGAVQMRALSAGTWHTCYLSDAGAIRCLGDPESGAGQGASIRRLGTPVLRNASMVTSGRLHSCGVNAEGLHCWGASRGGALGTTAVRSFTPRAKRVEGIEQVRHMRAAASEPLTCAIFGESELACWGSAGARLLGETPVRLETPDDALHRVTVGSHAAFVVTESGALYRYAINSEGGADAPFFGTPRRLDVPPLEDVGAGIAHRCGLGKDGAVRCWGLAAFGRLGQPDGQVGEVVPAEDAVVVSFGG